MSSKTNPTASIAPNIGLMAIIASNAVTVALAAILPWGLLHLLWPYFVQNLVIGLFWYRRIRCLEAFCTDNVTIMNRSVDPTPATRDWIARFFAIHYGAFHLAYLVVLIILTTISFRHHEQPLPDDSVWLLIGVVTPGDLVFMLAIGISFYFSHRLALADQVAADRSRKPDIGRLMILPYARVLPMHMVLAMGPGLGQTGITWLFATLKTITDGLMHWVEERWMARSASLQR